MFESASSFNQDIRKWDIGRVMDTEEMFDGAIAMQKEHEPAP